MSYYQSGYPSAPAGYQSQQYNTQGYYGGSQQQGQYGGAVRYPQVGSYQQQAPAYTPNQQINKNINEPSKQPSYQYPNTTGYGQDSSTYFLPQNQKNYSRPNQTPVPAYSYNNYGYPTAGTAQTGYVYPYTGKPTNQQQPPLPKQPYTPSTNNTATDVTPQQQQAIQNWIEEKHGTGVARGVGNASFNRVGGRSRFGPAVPSGTISGTQNKRFKRSYPRDSQRSASYFCETCKVSCGTSDAYNTHLSGKSHKKKSSNPMPTLPNTGKLFKCDVCDVMCTGKDAFKAHIVGTKHKKVVKLYEVMGKPIPEIKDAPIGFSDVPGLGAHLQKTGRPLINFVKSSKELKMKGDGEDEEETIANTEENLEVTSSGGKRKSKSKRKGNRSDKPFVKPLRIGLEGFTDGFGVPLHTISTRDVFVPPPRLDQWQQMERYFIDTSLRRNRFDDYSILDVHRKIYPSQKELESLYGTLEDVEKSLNVISLKLHHEQIDKLKESLQNAAEEEKPMEIKSESIPVKNEAETEQADMTIDAEGNNNGDSVVVQEKGEETDNKNSDFITREQEDSVRKFN
ncbi:Zinc finger RNA-binding protein-like [Oopsacas minuta]|uniref:Zinc finger RNA-binding protein-like n=1 Tax=Oopsacas minuta TaxID=111878 RepID=A0AAV7JAT2_9METZ|nr:Zinc finger RNA-binding protein-like [Oopsacas minuta]